MLAHISNSSFILFNQNQNSYPRNFKWMGDGGYTSGVVPHNIFRGIYSFMLKVLEL